MKALTYRDHNLLHNSTMLTFLDIKFSRFPRRTRWAQNLGDLAHPWSNFLALNKFLAVVYASKCRRRRHIGAAVAYPIFSYSIFGDKLWYYDTKKISTFCNYVLRFFCLKCSIFAKMLDLPPQPEPAEAAKTRVWGIYSPGTRNVLQMSAVWVRRC